MIYGLLEVGQFLEKEEGNHDCENFIAILNPACRSLFIFAQMYFIFLNTKLTIYKYKKFARFGLMHMVATNLCVWMNVLIEETNHELHSYMEKNGGHGGQYNTLFVLHNHLWCCCGFHIHLLVIL